MTSGWLIVLAVKGGLPTHNTSPNMQKTQPVDRVSPNSCSKPVLPQFAIGSFAISYSPCRLWLIPLGFVCRHNNRLSIEKPPPQWRWWFSSPGCVFYIWTGFATNRLYSSRPKLMDLRRSTKTRRRRHRFEYYVHTSQQVNTSSKSFPTPSTGNKGLLSEIHITTEGLLICPPMNILVPVPPSRN